MELVCVMKDLPVKFVNSKGVRTDAQAMECVNQMELAYVVLDGKAKIVRIKLVPMIVVEEESVKTVNAFVLLLSRGFTVSRLNVLTGAPITVFARKGHVIVKMAIPGNIARNPYVKTSVVKMALAARKENAFANMDIKERFVNKDMFKMVLSILIIG